MKLNAGKIRLSASDLSNHLACRHLTALDLSVAAGERPAPEWRSPDAWVLQQRGLAHESAYLEHLRSEGLEIVALNEVDDEKQAYLRTLSAMRAGAEVIAQGTLNVDPWFGRADVLRRVEEPSEFGPWSYEVYDCKLARETKGATILQLCLYSDLLASIQGTVPGWMHVITPDVGFKDEPYRVLDYSAYYRYVKAGFENAVVSYKSILTAAEPTSHCEICRWWSDCDAHWRKEDHLSLVAGITKMQREQLTEWHIKTVEQLAALPLPLRERPKHGSRETYVKVREQARVQVEARRQNRLVHEVLPFSGDHGFCLLPEPTKGDVFFDLEGDPFVGVGGREYLFGFVSEYPDGTPVYECLWALTEAEEKRAFEWLVDNLMACLSADPAMHIYHFAPYEPAALKRLMGRHATRENEIDRLLRSERFVDLHKVVRRAIRASVEQYSLKALESFHEYERVMPLENARDAMRRLQHRLELNEIAAIDKPLQRELAEYNADDCLSARSLRQWMERERTALESTGVSIPRPTVTDGAPSTKLDERQQGVAHLAEQLTGGINPDHEQRTAEENARWVLSNLLDWHRREKKAEWWEYYRLRDLREEELLEERSALAGLEFLTRTVAPKKNPVDGYKFEKQETNIRPGSDMCEREEKIGEVIKIDIAARTVDIRRSKKTSHRHPTSIFVDSRGPTDDKQADALFRLGIWVRDHGLEQHGRYQAAIDLLLCRSPRLRAGRGALLQPGESTVDAAKRICSSLCDSVLALQGPPGAGKTFTGARMICDLIRKRKKIGVTACSHRVIRKLLEEVVIAAGQESVTPMVCLHKVTDRSDEDLPAGIVETTDNAEALAAIECRDAQVVAGTSWLWSREEFFEKLDVLFIDEAGQMSLADALAVSQAARSIVLLGDPQQLEQPCKGTHPEGVDVSALAPSARSNPTAF